MCLKFGRSPNSHKFIELSAMDSSLISHHHLPFHLQLNCLHLTYLPPLSDEVINAQPLLFLQVTGSKSLNSSMEIKMSV